MLHEELDDPGQETASVDRAVDDAGCLDPVTAQCGQEGHRGPTAVRHTRDQPLASVPPMRAGHVGLRPGLIDEDQARRVNASLVMLPSLALAGDVGAALLGGVQGVFFHMSPSEARNDHTVP